MDELILDVNDIFKCEDIRDTIRCVVEVFLNIWMRSVRASYSI